MTTTAANNLEEFATILKENGFTVIGSKKYNGWNFFYKDGRFGTVSKDRLAGFSFSTVHKPCRECGTGYRMSEDFEDLTIENATKALCFAPNWATQSDMKAIRKYKDVEDFINSVHNKWAEYTIK